LIDRSKVLEVLEGYDLDDLRIGMIASHSALDTADGAVEENFRTLAVCQEGREKPYSQVLSGSTGQVAGSSRV